MKLGEWSESHIIDQISQKFLHLHKAKIKIQIISRQNRTSREARGTEGWEFHQREEEQYQWLSWDHMQIRNSSPYGDYRSWKTHIMEMKLVNVGVQLQIYANFKDDGMIIM